MAKFVLPESGVSACPTCVAPVTGAISRQGHKQGPAEGLWVTRERVPEEDRMDLACGHGFDGEDARAVVKQISAALRGS